MTKHFATMDGNEAAARIAHLTNEVIAIYPITPASAMGELADAWSAGGKRNLWGVVPEVVEMQSEGGAAGAVHGALQTGALTTTFTASQGLLLMIPNMFKIAGELTPAVIHVAARSLATHALSIFGDHSDVMSARSTGFAMLCAGTVQECHDFALISQASTLASRIPFLHFFDGFRTSHEVNKIELLDDDDVRALLDEDLIAAHRSRALEPMAPVLRGTAQNPDVFFQAREAINPYYDAAPKIVQGIMDRLSARTGRSYRLFDWVGPPDADRAIIVMGSAAGAAEHAMTHLQANGEKVGVLKVRLYRPLDGKALVEALPASVKAVAVLDRTKEPGAPGEPLFLDVVAALHAHWTKTLGAPMPQVVGGRYGLSSKEFTPAMAVSVFAGLSDPEPRHGFTIGIRDDVTHTSLDWDPELHLDVSGATRAVFFGLGSDGTVGANKNSIKIIGESTPLFAQGYFVYDSKKSGSVTTSHLRFGQDPIDAPWLIQQADFVACHSFGLLDRLDVLSIARRGATVLLNAPFGPTEVWDRLPAEVQEAIISKGLRVFVIDGDRVAREADLGNRINTVMQTCFFALAEILPRDEAIERIKETISKTWGRRGESVVRRNVDAVDAALAELHEMVIPASVTATRHRPRPVPADAPDFIQRVTSMIISGKGDLLPVSAFPVDGTFPTGTARYEKRGIAAEIPVWDASICIQCGLCPLVCPHAAIRMKVLDPAAMATAPAGFETLPWKGKEYRNAGSLMTIQIAPDDCTGCHVCAEVCPARSKEEARHKALDMEPRSEHLDAQRPRWDFFLDLPEADRTAVEPGSIKGSQLLEPLFEFSGACAGCGETPYLKLLTQLFGDRALVANATGCSSIFGGNLPTTPWAKNAEGRGPAWANSLFEDNAEFGLGMRLAQDAKEALARNLCQLLSGVLGDTLVDGLLTAPQTNDGEISLQRERVAVLKARLATIEGADAARLLTVADALVRHSVWIVGGDGWAYDIGFGGLDHVIASGRDVNILVLDTEVYSNTGGQASKATPRGAAAKFAAAGKGVPKKDLGMIAMAYGTAYVSQISLGAKPQQTIHAFMEAERHPGPSLLIAYSPCIAHGIDMAKMVDHQKQAVACGYWPLYRFDPASAAEGHPFRLDSRRPTLPLQRFAETEGRFALLARSDPERAGELMALAQRDIDDRWRLYEGMAAMDRSPTLGKES